MRKLSLKIGISLIGLLLLPVLALAQENWITVESRNFKFYGNGDRGSISKTANRLEQFRGAFALLFPDVPIKDPVETKVFYFKDLRSFRPFLPRNRDGSPDTGIAGYFLATESANYIAVSNRYGAKSDGETIFHEYVHYLLSNNFRRSEIPAWLNEGLAEYYSTIKLQENKRIVLGDLIDGHILFLRKQKPMPVKRLFEYENKDIHRTGDTNRSIFYAQSWALIHLLASQKKLDRVSNYIKSLKDSKDHKKTFEEVFGLTYESLDTALAQYVKKKKFTRHVATLRNELKFDTSQKFDAISVGQANAELSALSFHKGHYLVAEGLARKSIDLEPKNALANTTIGLMRLQQNRHDEARKFLEVAVENGSKDYYAQYSYAYVVSRIGMDKNGFVLGYSQEDTKKMRAAAKESIRLRPDFVPAYNILAFVNLVSGSNLEESIGFIQRVLQLQPGNEVAWLTLAQIYVRNGRLDEAEQIAKRILQNKPENQTRSTVQLVLDSVKRAREVDKQNAELDKRRNSGERVPALVVVRDELSDEDVARIQLERDISVMNQSLVALGPREERFVGYIQKITCTDTNVRFVVKSKTGESNTFRSRNFQQLTLMALRTQLDGAQVGCGVNLSRFLAVLNYVPGSRTLKAITFVPEHFRLKSGAEINKDTSVMVVKSPDGKTTTRFEVRDAPDNESSEEAARRERLYELATIKASLKAPGPEEAKIAGTLERVECVTDLMTFFLRTKSGIKEFSTNDYQSLDVRIYLKDASNIRIGCGIIPPTDKVIITYKKDSENSGDSKKVTLIEVVPKDLKLD